MNHINVERPIVDFIIVGAQKAGTTSAAHNLAQHPQISLFAGVTKYKQYEIEYYNQHWEDGHEWYRSHFTYTKPIVGEKTAELLHRTITHGRMQETVPNAKLIVFLRDPVERAFSQWKMATRPNWRETRSFYEVVEHEESCILDENYREAFYKCSNKNIDGWREGYLLKGFYAEQLKSLREYFPAERIHVAIAEQVLTNMSFEYEKIWSFLGLGSCSSNFTRHFVSANDSVLEPDMRQRLKRFYAPLNRQLFDLLGYSIPEWT